MAVNEKLSNSPIKEATLKVGFNVINEALWDSLLERLIDELKAEYPIVNKRVLFRAKGETTLSSDEVDNASLQNVIQDGYSLADKLNNRRVLIRKGNLEVYKSQPYVEWDEIYADFRRIIFLLQGVVFYRPIVKYQNIFHLNVTQSNEIDEFLELKVLLPHSIPPFAEKMAVKINMSDDREGNIVYDVEQLIEGTTNAEKPVRVKLNINVESRNHESSSVDELFDEFDKLRACKNKIFFSLITAKAKENFI